MKCIKNSQCSSGFCDYGKCNESPGLTDPCKPDRCSRGQVCDTYTNICRFERDLSPLELEKRRKNECVYDSDCRPDYYCHIGRGLNFTCEQRKGPGKKCKSDDACLDGTTCGLQGKCITRCLKDSDCLSGEVCPSGNKYRGFRHCVPKPPKPESVVDIQKPQPPPVAPKIYVHTEDEGPWQVDLPIIVWAVFIIFLLSLIITIIVWAISKCRKKKLNASAANPSEPPMYPPHTPFPSPVLIPPAFGAPPQLMSPYYSHMAENAPASGGSDSNLPPSYQETAGTASGGFNSGTQGSFHKQ